MNQRQGGARPGLARPGWAGRGLARRGFSISKGSDMNATRIADEFDLSRISLGTVISQEECEHLFGVTHRSDPEQYNLCLVQFYKRLERRLHKLGRMHFTLRSRKGDVVVLTSRESKDYNRNYFSNCMGGMRLAHRRMCGIKRSDLSMSERSELEQTIARQGIILSSMRTRIDPAELVSVSTRTVPSMKR